MIDVLLQTVHISAPREPRLNGLRLSIFFTLYYRGMSLVDMVCVCLT